MIYTPDSYKFRTQEEKEICEKLAESENVKVEEWVKNRYSLLGKLGSYMPDFRKAQNTKRSWRLNRSRYIDSINAWHSSTQGKRFHRQLGRFLALRAPLYREKLDTDLEETINCGSVTEATLEGLVALNSLKTHILIEKLYIEPDLEKHVLILEFLDLAYSQIGDISSKLENNENLSLDDFRLLEDLK